MTRPWQLSRLAARDIIARVHIPKSCSVRFAALIGSVLCASKPAQMMMRFGWNFLMAGSAVASHFSLTSAYVYSGELDVDDVAVIVTRRARARIELHVVLAIPDVAAAVEVDELDARVLLHALLRAVPVVQIDCRAGACGSGVE